MQVVSPALLVLSGNGEDEVEVARSKAGGLDHFPGLHDLLRRMTAAKRVERGVIETLYAHRDARDADLLECGELVGAHRRRRELDGPFAGLSGGFGHGLAEAQ